MTLERWRTFSRRDQLGHIGAEILRADMTMKKDKETSFLIIERALELVDLALSDQKWKNDSLLLWHLRDKLARAYQGKERNLKKIYDYI